MVRKNMEGMERDEILAVANSDRIAVYNRDRIAVYLLKLGPLMLAREMQHMPWSVTPTARLGWRHQ